MAASANALMEVSVGSRQREEKRTITDVRECVQSEGFEYTLLHYSDFADVDDSEFHRLRRDYIAAQKALAEYIGVEDE